MNDDALFSHPIVTEPASPEQSSKPVENPQFLDAYDNKDREQDHFTR
jgi:hypothetical protein